MSRYGAVHILLAAGIGGGIVGAGPSLLPIPARPSTATVTGMTEQVTPRVDDHRARPPQPGDIWRRCADAWAAGTAPIYRNEPGYREGLDGDDDGIACEPIRR